MRVICPSCAAEYEVEDALIPASGREVECASCGHHWHQPGPRIVLRPEGAVVAAAEAEDDPPPLPPRAAPASAAALAILREEAARELQARAAERPADEARAQVAAATRREAPADAPEVIEAELVEDDAPLPDPKAMAASLNWPDPQAVAPPAATAAHRLPPRRRSNRGYDAGFGLVLALSLLAVGAYVAAPPLAGQGRAGTALGEYRAAVDDGRLWLYDRAAPATDQGIAAIRELIER
ncbi:hypothetical protein GI374_01470 [Paracoccus sp. S-4012]|uniref:zinc-ribbon domain-containing protein n=1 Tax=Paracoccus sp. S-4012 TaxID=2665648 RepID=UPI0012B11F72|nr:zinc-ribbon domain-containing protein [Paracoccus sp. S-4012]MRX49127.1 hypothetical protein [Paracoccus sp. S-4012]